MDDDEFFDEILFDRPTTLFFLLCVLFTCNIHTIRYIGTYIKIKYTLIPICGIFIYYGKEVTEIFGVEFAGCMSTIRSAGGNSTGV